MTTDAMRGSGAPDDLQPNEAAVGVDVGGTTIKAGVVTRSGDLVLFEKVPATDPGFGGPSRGANRRSRTGGH